MAKLTFFPLGNADSTLIDLTDGKKILFDFGDEGDRTDEDDKRWNLTEALRADLAAVSRDYIDYVVFTHIDRDHTCRASEFFWFEHAARYQGKDRIKIRELWVPAAVLCDDECDEDDARLIRAEARYRFKKGSGIRVFSEPSQLEKWLNDNGLSLKERGHLITNAGELIPGLTTGANGVEFFVHCPFAHRTSKGQALDRNDDALAVQAKFVEGGVETKVILGSDISWEMWVEIVALTQKYGNDARLEWDVFKLPHHCSYLSLGPEKGKTKTEPEAEVVWLFEEQGRDHGIVIATSDPIPDEDTIQPPHFQAANYHRATSDKRLGHFIVTMENPSTSAPEPLVIKIDRFGATVERKRRSGVAVAVSSVAPRAG